MDKRNPNIHSSLLALVGGYLLYLSWSLLQDYRAGSDGMPPWAQILFTILFAAAGIAILIYAGWVWKKGQKKKEEEEGQK